MAAKITERWRSEVYYWQSNKPQKTSFFHYYLVCSTLFTNDWLSVKSGYFVLLSNKELTPAELLTDYFGRTDFEEVIKTSKEYQGLVPLSKRMTDTIQRKRLGNIVNTIIKTDINYTM